MAPSTNSYRRSGPSIIRGLLKQRMRSISESLLSSEGSLPLNSEIDQDLLVALIGYAGASYSVIRAATESKNSGQSLDHNTQANNSIFDFSRAQAILDEVKHLTEMFQQERLQQSSDFFKEQSLLEARIRILEQSKDIHRKIEDLANSVSKVEDKTLRLWNILPIKLWRRIRGIS